MLIQIPKVYTKDTEEKVCNIWINTELIIKIKPSFDLYDAVNGYHGAITNT